MYSNIHMLEHALHTHTHMVEHILPHMHTQLNIHYTHTHSLSRIFIPSHTMLVWHSTKTMIFQSLSRTFMTHTNAFLHAQLYTPHEQIHYTLSAICCTETLAANPCKAQIHTHTKLHYTQAHTLSFSSLSVRQQVLDTSQHTAQPSPLSLHPAVLVSIYSTCFDSCSVQPLWLKGAHV